MWQSGGGEIEGLVRREKTKMFLFSVRKKITKSDRKEVVNDERKRWESGSAWHEQRMGSENKPNARPYIKRKEKKDGYQLLGSQAITSWHCEWSVTYDGRDRQNQEK